MKPFYDPITTKLQIRNFKPNRHSLLLEKVLKGCVNIKELELNLTNVDDSNQVGRFVQITPEVVQ